MSTATTPKPHPYHLAEHPSVAVLDLLAADVLEARIQGTAMIAVVRLLLQDRQHQEKMALAEAKRLDTLEKERLANERQWLDLKIKKRLLALRVQEFKLKKKERKAKKQTQTAQAPAPKPRPIFGDAVVEVPAPVWALMEKGGIAPGKAAKDARAPSPIHQAAPPTTEPATG